MKNMVDQGNSNYVMRNLWLRVKIYSNYLKTGHLNNGNIRKPYFLMSGFQMAVA